MIRNKLKATYGNPIHKVKLHVWNESILRCFRRVPTSISHTYLTTMSRASRNIHSQLLITASWVHQNWPHPRGFKFQWRKTICETRINWRLVKNKLNCFNCCLPACNWTRCCSDRCQKRFWTAMQNMIWRQGFGWSIVKNVVQCASQQVHKVHSIARKVSRASLNIRQKLQWIVLLPQ